MLGRSNRHFLSCSVNGVKEFTRCCVSAVVEIMHFGEIGITSILFFRKCLVLILFQIILGHENSEPSVTQLRVQFMQVLSAFQVRAMSRYFGLLIGNSVAYFPMSCACHN